MIQPFTWTCRYCHQPTTVNSDDISLLKDHFSVASKSGDHRALTGIAIRCPNPECRELSLTVHLVQPNQAGLDWAYKDIKQSWTLLPKSGARVFPDYIPSAIRQDYEEAYAILEDSPKASATLARRCLQGMIRDFWKVSKGTLFEEIEAIRDKVDPTTWDAIDAVRSVGNIGAHMEKDVNVVVDVDSGEAEQLIALVETLLREWYVARHERKNRMQSVIDLAQRKKTQKQNPASSCGQTPGTP